MAMLITLAANVAITGLAAQTGVLCSSTPFLPGRVALARNSLIGGAGVVKIQSSPDNTTWTDVISLTATTLENNEVLLDKYMRTNVTTIGTGNVDVQLEGVQ